MRYTTHLFTATALALMTTAASAAYPEKPLRFLMPYPSGGSVDTAGRLIAQKLGDNLGQAIVVENRAGAGGTIGMEAAARAAPDGYTIVMGGTGVLTLSPFLQKNLSYDPIRDFQPITNLVSTPYVLVVHPSFTAKSAKELIDMAKARPGQINYASGGIGSTPHLAAELFKSTAAINMVHVAYKGSAPAIADVLAGHVPLIFTGYPSVISYVKSGKLHAIGVTALVRSVAMPTVPTIAETGLPGFDLAGWYGVLAPAKTPRDIVMKLNGEIIKVINTPEMRERFTLEGNAIGDSPEQFGAYIKTELARWGKVLKEAGIQAE